MPCSHCHGNGWRYGPLEERPLWERGLTFSRMVPRPCYRCGETGRHHDLGEGG